MGKKEFTNRNIGIAFDFIRAVVDHPGTLKKIQNGSELDLIEKDLPLKSSSPTKKEKVAR
jgi:hypothetical protein